MKIDSSSNPGTSLENVSALGASDASLNQANRPAGYQFRDGVVSYNVTGVSPGATIDVRLAFPSWIRKGSKLYQVNKDGFYPFPETSRRGKTVTLALTDGGSGDNDGVQDGTIVVTVGMATPERRPCHV